MTSGTTEGSSDDSNHYGTVGSSGLLVILGTAIGFSFSFLAKTIPAGLLGPEKYGSLVLAFATVSTVYLFAQMGLPVGVARNLPRFESSADQRGIVLSAFSISLPVSVALSAMIFVGSDWIASHVFAKPALANVLEIFAVLAPALVVQQLVVNVFRGYKRSQPRVVVRDIVNPVARFVLITGAILLGFDVVGAAIGWVAGVVLASVYACYLLYRETEIFELSRFEPYHRMLLVFSLPLMVSTMSRTVLQQADSILLGVLQISSNQIAVYDISFTIGRLITWAVIGFHFLFVPVFSELSNEEKITEMRRLLKIVTKWVVFLTLPFYCLLVLYPGPILGVVGSNYVSGKLSLVILSTGFLINSFFGLGKMSLISIGRTRYVMWGDLGTAVVNILLNFALIPLYGIEGAAFASALSYAGFNVLYSTKLFTSRGIHPLSRHLLKPAFWGVLAVGLSHLVIVSLVDISVWHLPAIGVLFAAIFLFVFVFHGGLQRQDLDVIRSVESGTGLNLEGLRRRLDRFVE